MKAFSGGPGQGSEFVVWLPLARQQASAGSLVSIAPPVAPSRSCSVMIVEDDADIRGALLALLELEGYFVRAAAGAGEALGLLDSFTPDVVLIDIGLAEMDGYELARRLRQSPWGSRLLLAAVTGYGQPQDRARALAAGFDTHLTKPIKQSELFAVLDSAAALRAKAVANPA